MISYFWSGLALLARPWRKVEETKAKPISPVSYNRRDMANAWKSGWNRTGINTPDWSQFRKSRNRWQKNFDRVNRPPV